MKQNHLRDRTAPQWAELFAGIPWHQRWEIATGVFTPGRNSVEAIFRAVRLPERLDGLRILDVGAWNGCFSFECERRGAADVIAYSLEHPDESGFSRLKDALGSRVRYIQGSVYDLSPDRLGKFDLILFFGVLYHLRYPLLAIDRLRTVSQGSVLVETHVVRDRFLLRGRRSWVARLVRLSRLFSETPIWRQYAACELHPRDRSNWFGPNIPAVIESFESGGFVTEHLGSWGERAAFRASLAIELVERLQNGSYEGLAEHEVDVGLGGRQPPSIFRPIKAA